MKIEKGKTAISHLIPYALWARLNNLSLVTKIPKVKLVEEALELLMDKYNHK